jgi:hypothetical protein
MKVNNATTAAEYAAAWKSQATPGRAAQRLTAAANDCESRGLADRRRLPEFSKGMLDAARVLRIEALQLATSLFRP